MSEHNTKSSSILLPQATIDIFALTKKTIKLAQALKDDWRFARVNVNIEEGGVEASLNKYNAHNVANLVLIETNDTGDVFTDQLGQLAGYCPEGTSAIVIGSVNDVNLYRKLTSLGVSDYLVHPLNKEDFTDLISATLINRIGVEKSNLIVCDGSKGGVGTGSIANLISVSAADKLGVKTIAVDASGGMSTLPVAFGFEPVSSLQEVVEQLNTGDDDSLKRLIYDVGDNLSILASGNDPLLEDIISAEDFELLINHLLSIYPLVVVDVSNAPASLKAVAMSRAHKIVIVTTPIISALRLCRTKINEIRTMRGGGDDVISLIVNKQGLNSNYEVSNKEIQEALEFKPDLYFKWEPNIFYAAESSGQFVHEMKNIDKLISPILELIEPVIGSKKTIQTNEKSGFLSKLLGRGN